MKKAIKLTCLALSLCLIMGIFAGCGKDTDNDDKTSNKGSNNAMTDSLLTALKFEADEKMDLSGKTLTIALWESVPERGSSDITDRRYLLADKVEEKYGVKIEWKPVKVDTFEKDMALAYTTGKKVADLFFAPHYNAYSLCKIGAVMPLDDYIDYNSEFYRTTGNNLRYIDGKHYSYMPDFYNVNDMGLFVMYNQTLVEAAGCDDPYELYEQGKWNWSAFEEIVKKTTKISNGKITQYGIGNSRLIEGIMMSNGVSAVESDYENNEYKCGFFTEEGYNALNFVKKLVFDYGSNDGCYGSSNSNTLFVQSKMAMMISANYSTRNAVSSGMPVVCVPLPVGDDVEEGKEVLGKEIQEWWMCSTISDFTPEQLVQLALELNQNIPEYEDTFIEDDEQFFVDLLYEQNVVTTEEEAIIFYNLLNSDNTNHVLDINLTDITKIKLEMFKLLAQGQDARTVIDTYKPNINSTLESLAN